MTRNDGGEMRSRARAKDVAAHLGLRLEPDAEIPTTFHLVRGDGATLAMGSPVLRRGMFHSAPSDWMDLRAHGVTTLPAGACLHPPRRTVFEWRDGLPGEAPTHVTPGGVELVAEGDFPVERYVAWVDRIPAGIRLVIVSHEEVRLRADAPGAAAAARWAAETLFELLAELRGIAAG